MLCAYTMPAARDAARIRNEAWPSRAAFELALSQGSIQIPTRAITGERPDGLLRLECGHTAKKPSAKSGSIERWRHVAEGKRATRPCPACVQQRYDARDPALARELAVLTARRCSELSRDADPSRREALEVFRQRFAMLAILKVGGAFARESADDHRMASGAAAA